MYPNIATNFKSQRSRCHQHHDQPKPQSKQTRLDNIESFSLKAVLLEIHFDSRRFCQYQSVDRHHCVFYSKLFRISDSHVISDLICNTMLNAIGYLAMYDSQTGEILANKN